MTDWFGFVVAQWPAGELVLASRALAFQWFGILSIWLKFFVFCSITLHNGRTCIAIIICSNTWQLEWRERHTKWYGKWKCTAYKKPVPPERRKRKSLATYISSLQKLKATEILSRSFQNCTFKTCCTALKASLNTTQPSRHMTLLSLCRKKINFIFKNWNSIFLSQIVCRYFFNMKRFKIYGKVVMQQKESHLIDYIFFLYTRQTRLKMCGSCQIQKAFCSPIDGLL